MNVIKPYFESLLQRCVARVRWAESAVAIYSDIVNSARTLEGRRHLRKPVLIVTVLYALSSVPAAAVMISYVAGQPTRDGNIEFTVKLNSGVKKIVTVAIKATDTPADKIFRIQVAMQLQGVDAQLDKKFPNTLNLNNVTDLVDLKDQTGELDEVSAPVDGAEALIDYNGILSGLDMDGLEAVYQASFGFDGLLVQSNLKFGELSGTTIDSLLTDIFDDFSTDLSGSPLLSNLSLDLTSGSIVFQFPSGKSNYFVQNFTSDTTAEASMGLSVAVPEPNSLILFAVGIMALSTCHCFVGRPFRRQSAVANGEQDSRS